MTNLELARQQGNQAAPNLLDAAVAGELGGGGSLYILPEQANLVTGTAIYSSSSDQVDEEAAQAIYDNFKIVNPKLEVFYLEETLADESVFHFYAFSQRVLDMIKSSVAGAFEAGIISEESATEILSVLDTMSPDELIYADAPIFTSAIIFAEYYNFDGELPPITMGLCRIICSAADNESADLSYYTQMTSPFPTEAAIGLLAITHSTTSLLDRPVKLDKPIYAVTSN